MDVSRIANERDICVHAGKSTAYAFQHREEVRKRNPGPEVYSHLTVIHGKGHPMAHSPDDLQRDFQQHAHHDMEPEEVGPLLPPHYPEIGHEEVGHQEPSRERANGHEERVCHEFQGFQKMVQVVGRLSVHPGLVEGH